MRLCCLGLISVLILSACGPLPSGPNIYQRNSLYPHNFVSPVAVLVQERNGQPSYFASAFLKDKKVGLLVTAKHFVEDISGKGFKIFLNGRVYGGLTVATPAISDSAVVGIQGTNFNSTYLPEPLSFSESQLKVGDSVRIWGVHPHPAELQANKVLFGIFRGYYGMFWQRSEFVFDELEAKVSALAVEVKNKDIVGTSEGVGFISNTYIEIITTEDHQFSFGGLSGGPVVNHNNEVVGIVAHGQEGGYILDGSIVIYQPWNILRIVPVEELRKFMPPILVKEK